ncbi:MAG: phosphoribosylformylglycinamidine synthase [Sarcina sp.]
MVGLFFVEKKTGFDVEAKNLLQDFKENLSIENLEGVRLLNRYLINGDSIERVEEIIQEPPVDNLYVDKFPLKEDEVCIAVEYLPGQYDQRADATSECFAILNKGQKVYVKNARILVLSGDLNEQDIITIKKYYINTVDSREVNPFEYIIDDFYSVPKEIKFLNGFIEFSQEEINAFHKENSLAMSIEDLLLVQNYFKSEERNPSITEIKVIDTYWSDHCRHTTFETSITKIDVENGAYSRVINNAIKNYCDSREYVYEEREKEKDITLMDIAVMSMKEMRKRGALDDLDLSEEINACSINIQIETGNGLEDYLLMFKNETHNHPTEIEPFGGAATCLGGAIRDPLSGRTYVYQAMRITGSANPTVSINKTIEGKLPQRIITLGAAHGYSSYGNQIGLATGEVREIYHQGYMVKRMEVGAVLGAAPKENVVREVPCEGDLIILLGGKTGRDGCGGATGSSKEHNTASIEECGAEVQKGNPPTERKIQRLFRNGNITKLIKRCNDFGAGGVSVAIGELCDSLDINLDLVPKKYAGLDGTELAISESQERMAVVVDKNDAEKFIQMSNEENLEATIVANVTNTGYMRMYWNRKEIVSLKREFLNTNGAKQYTTVNITSPKQEESYFAKKNVKNLRGEINSTLKKLNVGLQKGLVERFDSTIGAGTVLMPFGGKYQLTPTEGMACKIPVLDSYTNTCSIMTSGLNPYISSWSPFHGAYYSIVEAVTKIVTMGGEYSKIRLTLQEYFEKLGNNPDRWGKPFAALIGAFSIQKELGLPAIGGKDSMSGSFGQMDVPPTLVAFAVTTEDSKFIKSPEFKQTNSKIVLIKTNRTTEDLLNIEQFKDNLNKVYSLNKNNDILAMTSVKDGGIVEAITKMAIGNKIGAQIKVENDEMLFESNYGSIILEVSNEFDFAKLENINYTVIGQTRMDNIVEINEESFEVDYLINTLKDTLDGVFKIKTEDVNERIENITHVTKEIKKSKFKFKKPRVLIPVFPGTNCEYDSRKAFEKAGAEVSEVIFKNLNATVLEESLAKLESEIKKSQIIMIPGGFSAGDEPDGSAKFIATVFRNEKIKDAVTDLLENRDGLVLGVCNGFQALIKLGLVPYGKIVDINETMPTLTYNNIGRHMSSIVKTRICSNVSPWFANVNVDDKHNVAISHGEGRFYASEEVLNSLLKNGQVATQYVDLNGNATSDMPYNPNGSVMAIEGITSLDGRVLGKMGHSERVGENLYKNIIGEFDQKIFEAGVNYFK